MSQEWAELKRILSENKYLLLFLVAASIFDGVSTSFAILKPGAEELNVVARAFIDDENFLRTTLYLCAYPLVLSLVILGVWVRASTKEYWRTLIEGTAVMKTTAGINNTLVYLDHATPITILVLAAMFGHYLTRLHIIWKRNKMHRAVLDKLPKL